VRFEDVAFAYPGARRPVLDGLCLTLRPGERVAVVGENGAGKTTFVKLLAGLYQPAAGRITVAGTDLADLDPLAWRRRVTAVFQDFVRYPVSLADNVAMAAPERAADPAAMVAAVHAAIQSAGLAGLVADLPDGLDTLLWPEGSGGTDLSGGQWQRIALARALFAVAAGRQLVILDEPTAHLDVRAETAFHELVIGALGAVTTVLISHRLSTVRPADRIALLRGGRVAEEGTHDELIRQGGEYARLFQLQAGIFV
jgi:ATP-binding cassette subfamily B protein